MRVRAVMRPPFLSRTCQGRYQETSDTTDWQVKTGRGAPKMGTNGYPVTPRLPNGTRAPGDKRPNFVFYFPDTVNAESCGGACVASPPPPARPLPTLPLRSAHGMLEPHLAVLRGHYER